MDVLDFLVTGLAVVLTLAFGVVVLPFAAVFLLVRWLLRRANPNKELKAGSAEAYAYLDENASKDSVLDVALSYVDDAVLGPHAQGVVDTFRTADLRSKAIFSVMDEEFHEGSLTWDKYHAPVETALDRIRQNAAQITNRMQTFDSKEFQRMGRIEQAGGYDEGRSELQRLAVMRSTLGEMDDFQQANDRLLAELERLHAELTKLTGSSTDTDEIIVEIQRLSDDAKYYS